MTNSFLYLFSINQIKNNEKDVLLNTKLLSERQGVYEFKIFEFHFFYFVLFFLFLFIYFFCRDGSEY